jgi:hypothetical protein
MAKKSKKPAPPDERADHVSELLELAERLHLPDGVFDCDVADECDGEAKERTKRINEGCLMDQLEYLLERGYEPARLAELIREYAGDDS